MVATYRCLLSLVLLLSHYATVRGHELPDGQIERSVQIRVKPDAILVEYTLAMSEATLENQLREGGEMTDVALSKKWNQYKKLVLPSLAKKIGKP